jgi:hypothetical protein
LRGATTRTTTHRRHLNVPEPADWLTLRQANEITGVPVPTLRKWALRDSVPSYLERTPVGQIRMVSLEGVYRRAEQLGREVGAMPSRREHPRPTTTPPAVDLTDVARAPTQPVVPEGTMLVPLDAWNKMLNQLGNLHEAGQQLAEARERAAKAETQAAFLKERLGELREDLARERERSMAPEAAGPGLASPGSSTEEAPPGRPAGLTAYPVAMTKQLFSMWKARRRR